MRNMVKVMTMMVLAIFATSTLSAQIDTAPAQERVEKERKSPEQRAEKQTERMVKHLDLTQEQAAKINAINLEYANQAKAEKEERKARMDAKNARIKEVLTDEQNAKFDKKMAKMKKKRKNKRGKRKMKGKKGAEKLKSIDED